MQLHVNKVQVTSDSVWLSVGYFKCRHWTADLRQLTGQAPSVNGQRRWSLAEKGGGNKPCVDGLAVNCKKRRRPDMGVASVVTDGHGRP